MIDSASDDLKSGESIVPHQFNYLKKTIKDPSDGTPASIAGDFKTLPEIKRRDHHHRHEEAQREWIELRHSLN